MLMVLGKKDVYLSPCCTILEKRTEKSMQFSRKSMSDAYVAKYNHARLRPMWARENKYHLCKDHPPY